jgi:hypothetical protein
LDHEFEISLNWLFHQTLLNALGASTDPFYCTIGCLVPHRLQIRLPQLFGLIVGMGNIIAILGRFAADFANAGHCVVSLNTHNSAFII